MLPSDICYTESGFMVGVWADFSPPCPFVSLLHLFSAGSEIHYSPGEFGMIYLRRKLLTCRRGSHYPS
jgi:hypothetical protein